MFAYSGGFGVHVVKTTVMVRQQDGLDHTYDTIYIRRSLLSVVFSYHVPPSCYLIETNFVDLEKVNGPKLG